MIAALLLGIAIGLGAPLALRSIGRARLAAMTAQHRDDQDVELAAWAARRRVGTEVTPVGWRRIS